MSKKLNSVFSLQTAVGAVEWKAPASGMAQVLNANSGKVWTALASWFLPGGAVRRARPDADALAPLPLPFNGEPQSDVMQWSKVSAVMTGAIGSAALAAQLQRSAGQQLDAAGYALDILRAELIAAMTIPSGRPAQSVVLQLPRSALRAKRERSQLAA